MRTTGRLVARHVSRVVAGSGACRVGEARAKPVQDATRLA